MGLPVLAVESFFSAIQFPNHSRPDGKTGAVCPMTYTMAVSSLTQTGNLATCTTSANHNLVTGESVIIAGATLPQYNGTFVVTVTGGTTFTYTLTGNPTSPAVGTITAIGIDEPAGKEAWHVADGRRSLLDFWQPQATNVGMYLASQCDRVRGANYVAIDRGHNQAGIGIKVECSNDNWSTVETAVDLSTLLMPSVCMPGTIDDPAGVRTEEGAWIKRFPLRTAKYWRLNIPPMGVGSAPKIIGLDVGLCWEAPYFWNPYSEDAQELVQQRLESSAGWIGANTGTRRRTYQITMKLLDLVSYDQARYHVGGHFGAGRPMWICHDQAQAERTLRAIRNGRIEWSYQDGWGYRQAVVPWVEHEPLLSS